MVEAAKDMVVGEKPKVFVVEGGTLMIVAIDADQGGFIGDPECGIVIPRGSGIGGGLVVGNSLFFACLEVGLQMKLFQYFVLLELALLFSYFRCLGM